MRGARLLLAAAALPLLGACVATKQDIRDVRMDIQAQRVAQDSVFRALVRRTEAMLDSISRQNGRMRGDLANRLVAIERQLVQIQELSGQNQAQLGQLRQQIEQRAAEAQRTQEAAAAPSGDAGELFDASVAALRRGSVASARAGFEEFLAAEPGHRLAPDAQYYIGQSHEQGREAEEAIEAYERVVELYPTSGRAPAALLRIARLELAAGNRAAARERLRRIVDAYPRSPEAGEARTELQRTGSR